MSLTSHLSLQDPSLSRQEVPLLPFSTSATSKLTCQKSVAKDIPTQFSLPPTTTIKKPPTNEKDQKPTSPNNQKIQVLSYSSLCRRQETFLFDRTSDVLVCSVSALTCPAIMQTVFPCKYPQQAKSQMTKTEHKITLLGKIDKNTVIPFPKVALQEPFSASNPSIAPSLQDNALPVPTTNVTSISSQNHNLLNSKLSNFI